MEVPPSSFTMLTEPISDSIPPTSDPIIEEKNSTVMEDIDESKFLEDIESNSLELDLTHCRLRHMGMLGLERFTKLQRLFMRQNLFSCIEGVHSLASSLKELDLYDNSISQIEPLKDFSELEYLDLSFNRIKSIPEQMFLKMNHLKELFLVANKLSKIEHLEGLHHLTNLELGANRIRVIENLDHLTSLTHLWLGKNKITELTGLSKLIHLQLLSIQSNRITSLQHLSFMPHLQEVYLSHNGILSLKGIEQLTQLKILDVCNNRILNLDYVQGLVHLEELWISHNQLSNWKELEQELMPLSQLHTLYLEGNPLQKEAQTKYRLLVKTMLPNLKQLDSTFLQL